MAADLSQYLTREFTDKEVVPFYEQLLQDKEAEVRSEAAGKLPELAKHCSSTTLVEKLLPILNAYTVTDASQHVRGSLAHSICELARPIGKEATVQFLVPPVVQMLKDSATEVRVSLMTNMKGLAEVIGPQEIEQHVIPALIQLHADKIWRVRLAMI